MGALVASRWSKTMPDPGQVPHVREPGLSPHLRIGHRAVTSDVGILVLLALAVVLLNILTNGQYGFHCDELMELDDARHGPLINRYGNSNDSIYGNPDVFICRRLREPWPKFWKHYYG